MLYDVISNKLWLSTTWDACDPRGLNGKLQKIDLTEDVLKFLQLDIIENLYINLTHAKSSRSLSLQLDLLFRRLSVKSFPLVPGDVLLGHRVCVCMSFEFQNMPEWRREAREYVGSVDDGRHIGIFIWTVGRHGMWRGSKVQEWNNLREMGDLIYIPYTTYM